MEKLASSIQKVDFGKIGNRLRMFCWDTGLGKALNAMPAYCGNQLVLSFPSNGKRLPLFWFEDEDRIYAIVPPSDVSLCTGSLLNSSAAEVWMPGGWYTATVQALNDAEKAELMPKISLATVCGTVNGYRSESDVRNGMLVEIRRNAPCTGEKGPGQYSWIWAALCLGLLLCPRRKK